MGDKGYMGSVIEIKKDVVYILVFLILFINLTFIVVNIPFENYLSQYPFYRKFIWYKFWRGTVFFLFTWLIMLALTALDIRIAHYGLWMSLIFFLSFHYLTLMYSLNEFRKITFSLLIYKITFIDPNYNIVSETIYLDLGQLLFLFTILVTLDYKKTYKTLRSYFKKDSS